MTIAGRRVTALAAVFAVVVAAIAVYLITAGSAGMSVAAGAGTPGLTAEQLQPFTLSRSEHPDGTEYAEAPISAGSFAVNQGGMVVTPQSCLGALPIVLGGAQVTGWTQIEPEVPDDPLASSTPTASVSAMPSPSVGATPSSSVSPAPTTSPRATPSSSGSPVLGEVAAVSKECVEHSSVSEKRMDITTEQYVAYAVVGNAYVEACAASLAEIDQLLAVPAGRLRAAGVT
jgi:hypothetical protein